MVRSVKEPIQNLTNIILIDINAVFLFERRNMVPKNVGVRNLNENHRGTFVMK